jgi:chromatin segregation and condensation protein Rec8/ScpA/Scc1 (kleisin family)
MMGILEQLKQSGDRAAFHELIPDLNSRYVIISSLIAMLELCKRAVIRIVQDREYDDIFVSLATTDVDVEQFSSEFDQGFEQSVTAHAG